MATVLFRDGPREVVDHLADLMAPIDTFRLTYEEAVKFVNEKLVGDHLEKAQNALIRDHFQLYKVKR